MKSGKMRLLENAIREFEESKRTAQDYFTLLVVGNRVLRPDAGLVWSQVAQSCVDAVGGEIAMGTSVFTPQPDPQDKVRQIISNADYRRIGHEHCIVTCVPMTKGMDVIGKGSNEAEAWADAEKNAEAYWEKNKEAFLNKGY